MNGAASVTACIITVAEEGVIARCGVISIGAPGERVACIISAAVPVITGKRGPGDTAPAGDVAAFNPGAEVVIRAVSVPAAAAGYAGIYAADLRIAAVAGTHVAVVAVDGIAALADPVQAGACRRAGIAVIAGGGVAGMDTAGSGAAGIGGADVAVIAIERCSADTCSIGAAVSGGAGVAVITGGGIVGMGAASRSVADIIGTDVAVISTGRSAGGKTVIGSLIAGVVAGRPAAAGVAGMHGAVSPAAGVAAVAEQTVVAGGGVIGVDTAGRGAAAVRGADVAVIAVECACPHTGPIGTDIAGRAEAVVIAGLIGAVGISAIDFAVPVIVNAVSAFFHPRGNTGNLDRPLTLIKGGVKCGHGYVVSCALV